MSHFWVTAGGKTLPVRTMTTEHIQRTMALLEESRSTIASPFGEESDETPEDYDVFCAEVYERMALELRLRRQNV